MKPTIQKCAIYTRKSHEKGLEQEFNTLDAQRESCLAYITSQKSEGWTPIKQLYDDGGYSGGSIERPALQQLLNDIKAGKINIIVVYKIDRLTRSLTDFAKLVEVFDQHGVSFVSVTQSFNTTTSMGRLTLNVLLSFAQFEREVIGERIRDKIAASKKKGMWMGGCPPLGYDIKDRHLIVNELEATDIKYIFDSYLELKTVARLKEYVDMKGIKSKTWIAASGKKFGGNAYGRGALHSLLSNPVYAGKIRHKGEIHEGLHAAIISKEKWQHAQDILINNSRTERGHKKHPLKSILKGKIFDTDGVIYTPMRANKNGKQYRYYVSQNRVQNRSALRGVIARLPAHEIEALVIDSLMAKIKDIKNLSDMLKLDIEENYKILEHISKCAEIEPCLHTAIHKVTVDIDRLKIDICLKTLITTIPEEMNAGSVTYTEAGLHSLIVPYHTKRAQRGAVMIRNDDGKDLLDLPKSRLESLVKGVIWRELHFEGKSFIEIAKESNCSRSLVIQFIEKSFNL